MAYWGGGGGFCDEGGQACECGVTLSAASGHTNILYGSGSHRYVGVLSTTALLGAPPTDA